MKTKKFLLLLATMAFQLVFSSAAWAHHPTITASVVCDSTGNAVIQYTSTSWSLNPGEGENAQIDILFNGVKVASGAYVSPVYSFSGSAPAPAGSGPGDPVTVTAYAAVPWGNGHSGGQSESVVVTIPTEGCEVQTGLGRFTGGGHQIRVGLARVTRGLTVHCDLLLSNNLEVNWGGNQFHMTEHLTTIECSDSPDIIQAPPAAPLDTMKGIGTGRYNGEYGYTIEFTFVDYGEPGGNDEAAFKIYKTSDPSVVVLNVPQQKLTGGNLQAHYDQPHK